MAQKLETPLSRSETCLLVERLQKQIDLVLDTVKCRRNLYNLWGLRQITSQTLAVGGIGERISPYCNVAGIRLELDNTTVKSIDDVIHLAMKPFDPIEQVPNSELLKDGVYRRTIGVASFTSNIGIVFKRIAMEEAVDGSELQKNLPSFGHHARSLRWTVCAISNGRK